MRDQEGHERDRWLQGARGGVTREGNVSCDGVREESAGTGCWGLMRAAMRSVCERSDERVDQRGLEMALHEPHVRAASSVMAWEGGGAAGGCAA